jgi:hypothetical protein
VEQGIEPGAVREALHALREGAAYVNVETDGFPTGRLRGQIRQRQNKKHKKKMIQRMEMDG